MSCGVGHRHGSDLALLWPRCRLASVALIGSLAWEPPCAVGVALEKAKRQKKKSSFEEYSMLAHILFFFFLSFLGLLLRHVEVPRLGVQLEL